MTIEETKDLIVGTNLAAVELYTPAKMDVLLAGIKKKVGAVVLPPDTSTDKNRKEFVALAYQITQSKTMIEKGCLKVTEKWRNDTKTANQSKKEAVEFLTALAVKTRQPVTDWEEEEKKRDAATAKCLEYFTTARMVTSGTASGYIMDTINKVDGYEYPEIVDEETAEALKVEQETTLTTLRGFHDDAIKAEQEKAELDALRAEKEDREFKEAVAKEKKERESRDEKTRKEIEERLKKEGEEKAAREQRGRDADAKREREETERKEKEEAATEEKRQSNTRRRRNVQMAAVDSLVEVCKIDTQTATEIVSDIDDGLIKGIQIVY